MQLLVQIKSTHTENEILLTMQKIPLENKHFNF